jgi:PAS domain S-box-containing protein
VAGISCGEDRDARLREALDALPHKVWIVKLDGPAVYYNRAMRMFAGAAIELPDRAGRERALVHADDLGAFVSARDAGLRDKHNWSIEIRLRCPTSDYRWHQLHVSLLRWSGEGEVWLVTATDIDDLQRALLAARHSEDQLRLAAAAAQLGIYSFDLHSREHDWSPELKSIFGLSAEAAAPERMLDWIHPEDRDRFVVLRQKSLDPRGPGTFQDEHRIVRRDGSVRWVLVKGSVSFAGEGPTRRARGGLGLVLDVTERKLTEQALLRSETRYRKLIESANDVVVTLDLDGTIRSVNPAVTRLLGYSPAEVVGKSLDDFAPADQRPIRQAMLQRKLEGKPSTRYDLVVQGKDGRRRILEVNSQLIFDTAGKATGVHSIARDITERKDAEARQSVLIRELQHRTKNLLAVIQSIVTNTLAHSRDLSAAEQAMRGRLHALARAQQFITSAATSGGVGLRELIEAELSPFATRFRIDGAPLIVDPGFAQQFALVIHELATNAAKYGSLSSPAGRVLIAWRLLENDGQSILSFSWRECGGPRVTAPNARGFGSKLIEVASMGTPRISYAAAGLEFRVEVALWPGAKAAPAD